MMVFDRLMKENLQNFQADMTKILSELNKEVRLHEDITEQNLVNKVLKLFCYLFLATDNSNLHTDFPVRDYTVSLGIAVSERSSKHYEADILVEVKRPAHQLSDKDLKSLSDCMFLAKAPWGILINGHKMLIYKLKNIKRDCSFEQQALLSVNLDNVTTQDIADLKEFAESCFKESAYIRGIKESDFVKEGIESVEQSLAVNAPYNRLFFFDELLRKLNPSDSVSYFTNTSNRDLFNEILIKDNDYFSLGIDLVSIQLFMKLNMQDRSEFMKFQSEFREMILKIFAMRNADADVTVIDSVFLEDFSKLMGYDFKSILLSGENVSAICKSANIAFGSEIPFKLIIHSLEASQSESKQFYEDLGDDKLILETNLWTYFIRLGNQKDAYLRFDLANMTFGNLYDLFLLSSRRYSDDVFAGIDRVSDKKLEDMNESIVNNYENRLGIYNQLFNALRGLQRSGHDVYLLETLAPKQADISAEEYQKMLDVIEELNHMSHQVDMLMKKCNLK